MTVALEIQDLCHTYGERVALNHLSLSIQSGELFALCGPNGGGKSTAFRILSTLVRPTSGRVQILGSDLQTNASRIRHRLGIVFQSSSLDKKLTVRENLTAQGHLYGLKGVRLRERIVALLTRMGLKDRANERAEKLSGGLRRRVEVAKGLLHSPEILLMDEPTTGLDPLVRRELWNYLEAVRIAEGTTVIFTTHLLDEAEHCNRLGLLHEGNLVALGTPEQLKLAMTGEVISIRSKDPQLLRQRVEAKFGAVTLVFGGELRLELKDGPSVVGLLMQEFGDEIDSITLGKPTIEDVFIRKTGYRFSSVESTGATLAR